MLETKVDLIIAVLRPARILLIHHSLWGMENPDYTFRKNGDEKGFSPFFEFFLHGCKDVYVFSQTRFNVWWDDHIY